MSKQLKIFAKQYYLPISISAVLCAGSIFVELKYFNHPLPFSSNFALYAAKYTLSTSFVGWVRYDT